MMKLHTVATVILAFRVMNGNACSSSIDEFNLIDTSVSPSIVTELTSTVDLSDSPTCSFSIEAPVSSSTDAFFCEEKPVKCVKFFMDGVEVHKTNAAPFTYSDDVVGFHNLKACTYSDDECSKDESGCKEMDVEFLGCDHPSIETSVVARELTGCKSGKVTGFQLVDTESPYRPVVQPFTPPLINLLDFPTCALNIYAIYTPGQTCTTPPACVKLTLGDQVRNEEEVPYALFGNTGRFIRSGKPALGAQTLTACAYTDEKCSKGKHGCLSYDVDIIDCVPTAAPVVPPTAAPVVPPTAAPVAAPVAAPIVAGSINQVTGFQLVDTESPYRPVITPFTPPIIDLLEFSTCELNIYATVSENTQGDAGIKCVKLTLGSQVRKEKFEPYALYGNTGRFIRSGKPALGAQTLKACTYTDEECSQGESGCLEVDVYVKDCVSMSM